MVDPKRLIKSMELCMGAERDCHKCMYCETENDCRDSMIYDAVELLKEQEPVEPERRFLRPDKHFDTYRCKGCDFMHLRYGQQFCGGCGRNVKWDD